MANYETRVRLVSETNVNVANNTSYVVIAFDFRRTDYPYYGFNYEGNAYWYISCDGQSSGNRYFTFGWEIPQGQWKEVGSCGFTVNHNANGTKNINFSGYIYFGDGVNPGNLSANGSAGLMTIPRATTPSLSPTSQVMGNDITIKLSPASSSFTHNLTYTFGNASGTIATDVKTSAAFTVPTSLVVEIPNAVSGSGKIICKTYNGSTLVGTKEVNFTAKIPDNVVPVIKNVTLSENIAAIKTKFNAYIQNKSRVRVVVSAEGVQGSIINSCKVTMDGVSYSGTDIVTNLIASAGSVNIVVTVTDSRGKSAVVTKTITVLEYYNPNIKAFSAYRCTDEGTEDDEAAGVKLVIDFDIAPVSSKNAKMYSVQVQKQGETTWTTIVSGSLYKYNSTYIKNGNVLDADCSYVVRLVVSDYFMETVAEVEIGTAFTLMDFHNSGRGIALGKVAQKEGHLEVNLVAEFLKNVILHGKDAEGNTTNIDLFDTLDKLDAKVADNSFKMNIDYIIEQGKDDYWAYRKWNSGLLEAWRCSDNTNDLNFSNPYGTVYYTNIVKWNTTGKASQFISVEDIQTTVRTINGGLVGVDVYYLDVSDGNVTMSFYLNEPLKTTKTVNLKVHIWGRWK